MSRLPYSELPTVSVVTAIEQLDPEGYLLANPDVRAAGLKAEEHCLRYGIAEGRWQFVNASAIQALRRKKLGRLSFREVTVPSKDGRFNFITPDIKQCFEIPDAPPVAANEYNPELIDIIRANPDRAFLDVGAGLRHTYYSNVVNTEIWSSASTDVICVAEELPFADSQFDYVFCLAVLEHTRRPWVAVQEIIRVTKPGGMIRIDWPFLQPLHGYPHHYFNVTPKGHRSQFEEQCDILSCDVRIWQHPIFALSWMLTEWRDGLPEKEREAFYGIKVGDLMGDVVRQMHLAQLPFCAHLSQAAQETIAAGTTLVARKRLGCCVAPAAERY